MPRAVRFGGLHEPLDLLLGEIFAAALANLLHLQRWRLLAKPCVFHGNCPPAGPYCYKLLTCNSARALTIENAEGSTRPRFCALRSISNCPLRTRREGEQSLEQPPRVFWGLC